MSAAALEMTAAEPARPRVLVVEGDGTLRRFLEAILDEGEFDITGTDSGDGALLHLGNTDFDCVLIGSPVPVQVSGGRSTVLEQFEQFAPHLASRLIVVTHAVTRRALLRRALRMRVFAIFGKPFEPRLLIDTVSQCVAGEPPSRRWFAIPQPVVTRVCHEESVPEQW